MDPGTPDDQELALRVRVGREMYAGTRFNRDRIDRSGFGKGGLHRLADLPRLPPMTLDDIATPGSLLSRGVTANRRPRRYAPLQWIKAGEVPLSYSDDDLVLLGDLGARILAAAGLVDTDVIANLIPPSASREHWQFLLGAQAANISSIALGSGQTPADIDTLQPTVIIGDAKELWRVLDNASMDADLFGHLHTIIVVGGAPTPRQYKRMVEHVGGQASAVVRAWAPDGVLALWGQCRGGTAFHTWPDAEILEVVDPVSGLTTPTGRAGHIVWTGTGWYASAILRLDTKVAVVAHDGPCPTCGRRTLRVEPMEVAAGFPEVLNASPNVISWSAELQRTDAGDELVVWIAPAEQVSLLLLISELNLKIGPVQVRLVDEAEVQRRLEEANGEQFGDRRAFRP